MKIEFLKFEKKTLEFDLLTSDKFFFSALQSSLFTLTAKSHRTVCIRHACVRSYLNAGRARMMLLTFFVLHSVAVMTAHS